MTDSGRVLIDSDMGFPGSDQCSGIFVIADVQYELFSRGVSAKNDVLYANFSRLTIYRIRYIIHVVAVGLRMVIKQATVREDPFSKPLVWLYGEIKTPPFTLEGRREAGILLRILQAGEQLGMPHAELLPDVGKRCGALRVRDAEHNWRIMYRIDPDAVLILEIYSKKTRKIPQEVIERCQQRLKRYDATVKAANRSAGN